MCILGNQIFQSYFRNGSQFGSASHDVSAYASVVQMEIANFPIVRIFSYPFEKSGDGQIASKFAHPIREKVRSLRHVKLRVDT